MAIFVSKKEENNFCCIFSTFSHQNPGSGFYGNAGSGSGFNESGF
jgi:hypothetical protein